MSSAKGAEANLIDENRIQPVVIVRRCGRPFCRACRVYDAQMKPHLEGKKHKSAISQWTLDEKRKLSDTTLCDHLVSSSDGLYYCEFCLVRSHDAKLMSDHRKAMHLEPNKTVKKGYL